MKEYSPNPNLAFISDVAPGPVCLRNILLPKSNSSPRDEDLHAEELDKAFITEEIMDDGSSSKIYACRIVGCTALCSIDASGDKPVVSPVAFSEYSVNLDNCRFESRY